MTENNYFRVSVKVEYEDDKGRVKYKKEEYLVNAIGPTDVETKVVKEMEGTGDYEIVSIVQTKILAVLN